MMPFIETAREMHRVLTVDAYRQRQASFIANERPGGFRIAVHASPAWLIAYVSTNRWVVDCECGAGNATDPEWGIACCFSCGAVHEHVRFPRTRGRIEAALLRRPQSATRNWYPYETVDDLIAENITHGLEAV